MGETLEEKWVSWQDCLEGEDTNSIFRQITLLTWDAAIFRLIIETRRMQIAVNPDQPKINLHLHQFIDRTFIQSQVSCIRRLIEPGQRSSLYGKWGVFSLSALLKDMAAVRQQLTREKYFQLRQLPYNYQSVVDWEDSADADELFDRLSNTSQRSPTDVIKGSVFKKLIDKLDSFEHVTKYVDKYIAHAATPNSRQADNVDEDTITWKHLWDSHKSLYEIAEFIALFLSGRERAPLPIKPPFLFSYWDEPFVSTSGISQLEIAWVEFKKETDNWRLNGGNRIWSYIDN